MDTQSAVRDIDFIKQVVRRTHANVDAHAFHTVIWGAIVLVWYPLANWFQDQENFRAMIYLGVGSVVCGMIGSALLEIRLRKPRLRHENTFIQKQIVMVIYGCIGAGCALSAISVPQGFIDGPNMPILWGLVYACMAFMVGVVYTREYLIAGLFIFVGSVLAIFFQQQAGYILGPFMGLGMIVPGLMGERRVKGLIAEQDVDG